MKRQKLFRSKSRKTKRRTGEQRRTGLLSFQQLEPRMLLAGDFAPYIDLDVATDWAAIHGTGGYNDQGYDAIVQDDGKIVVTGVIPKNPGQNSQDLLVARYNANGTIDTSFNGSGYNLVDFGTDFRDIGFDVALQDDGKIVAVGEGWAYLPTGPTDDHYLIAARFDSDGTLDATYTFGPGAPGAEPFGDFLWTKDALVQSSGKILILSAVEYTENTTDILLTRLNSDFTLDTSFGDGGIVVHDYNNLSNTGVTVAEQSDGKILVAGAHADQGYFVRFNSDGTPDGLEGTIDTSVLGRNTFNNLVVDANDNAYFYGSSWVTADGSDREIVIVKMDDTGNLDAQFGNGGIFRYNITFGWGNKGVLSIDQTGKLIAADYTNGLEAEPDSIYMIRVNTDGTLDTEYGSVSLPPDGGTLRQSMTFDASNRVVVTGNIVRPSTLNVWLLRVNPNVELADSFENGQWNGLWDDDGENDWFTSTQRSTEGIYSAEIDGRVTDAMLTVATPIPIDLSAYGSAELRFDWLIEGGFDGGEYLALDFLNEDGNWDQIAILRGNIDQEDIWHNELIQINDSKYLHNGFQFRYRAKANKSTEDANVDNVVLFGTSLAGPPNQAPTITSSPIISATEDLPYTYDVDGSDPDIGDAVTFSLVAAPIGMTIDPNTGVIQWTPNNSHVGSNPVTVRAQDVGGLFDMQSFDVSVTNVNDAPAITSSPVVTATAESLYSYDVEAQDPDIGDPLSYFLDASPSGMTIDSVGLIQWTPTTAQTGVQVTVRVQDAGGLFDTQDFSIDVAAVNQVTVVFSDNFEDGPLTDQWSQDSQNDWRRVTSKRFDGSYSAEVDGRVTDATLISNSIDMSGYGSAELTFAWLIEKGFDSGEFLALDFKDESGAWVTDVLILQGNVDQENVWHQETVALGSQYLHDDFQFQYRATVSSSREDAYVDTVQLLATSAASRGAIIDPNLQAEALALADLTYVAGWPDDVWNSRADQRKSEYELRIADLPGNLPGSAAGEQDHFQSFNDLIDQRFAEVSMTFDGLVDEHEIFGSLFDDWDEQQKFGDYLDHSETR